MSNDEKSTYKIDFSSTFVLNLLDLLTDNNIQKMKRILILMVAVLSIISCKEGEKQSLTPTGEINWITMEEASQLKNSDKQFIVDVYTEWCGWCKIMDKNTFTDEAFKQYISDKYYMVKFDAEQKAPIEFDGKTYEWRKGGRRGINALAIELLGGRMSYPTLVYLDKDLNKIKVSPGYKKPDQLLAELKQLQG